MNLPQSKSARFLIFASFLLSLVAVGWASKTAKDHWFPSAAAPSPFPEPKFDETYAFGQILKYESFGAKVPGTTPHTQAGNWIVDELKQMGLTVMEQKSEATTFDQKVIPVRNIIAQWNPKAKIRYLLSAHWDNRPFADQDPLAKDKPVPGVNDGGSGVVILLGIAKALPQGENPFGVDFAFWDAEDWGTPHQADSYCLGAQYWAAHPVPENYSAKYGINYDMVGRSGSVFPIESYSNRVAKPVVDGLRVAAKKLGYQDFFPDQVIGPITDDHYFVSEKTKIPFVDLIFMTPDGEFPPEWHTLHDTSEFISRDVLKVVGQTTLEWIWSDAHSTN